MTLDRFTIKAAEAIQAAEQLARGKGHGELSPIHVLAALLSPSGGERDAGVVVPILEKLGANVGRIRSITESELNRLPRVSGGSLAASPRFHEVLQAAQQHADRMKDQYVSTEHLLLALAPAKFFRSTVSGRRTSSRH
jgi:ATP-dependent Clp protease ATP-binding subunit ClpB